MSCFRPLADEWSPDKPPPQRGMCAVASLADGENVPDRNRRLLGHDCSPVVKVPEVARRVDPADYDQLTTQELCTGHLCICSAAPLACSPQA
jgi:hypothetical protein